MAVTLIQSVGVHLIAARPPQRSSNTYLRPATSASWNRPLRRNESVGEIGNWYTYEIGVPYYVLHTLSVVADQLTADELARYVSPIKRFVGNPNVRANNTAVVETGANRADKALISIVAGATLRSLRDLFDDPQAVDRLEGDLDPAGFDLREVEQVVDDGQQMLAAGLYQAQLVLLLGASRAPAVMLAGKAGGVRSRTVRATSSGKARRVGKLLSARSNVQIAISCAPLRPRKISDVSPSAS